MDAYPNYVQIGCIQAQLPCFFASLHTRQGTLSETQDQYLTHLNATECEVSFIALTQTKV